MQSSIQFRGHSDRAVDGNEDGIYFAEGCTHTTNTEADPWWRLPKTLVSQVVVIVTFAPHHSILLVCPKLHMYVHMYVNVNWLPHQVMRYICRVDMQALMAVSNVTVYNRNDPCCE